MPFPREQQQENYQQPAPQKLPGFPSTALPLPHRQQKPLRGCVVNCTGRLIKIKALERQASPAPHTFWSLHYTATWMFFSSMWRMPDEYLGVKKRRWRTEEGPKTTFSANAVSSEMHIKLWAHCTLLLVALLWKTDLQSPLFGLIYLLLFPKR